jgi:hypothetical protein
MCRNRNTAKSCVATVKFFLMAEVKPEHKDQAMLYGLPVEEPLLLAVCELRELEECGVKIPPAWERTPTGKLCSKALKDSGAWEGSFSALAMSVNELSALFRAKSGKNGAIKIGNELKRVAVNVSSALMKPDSKGNDFSVDPLVAFDPARCPVVLPGLRGEANKQKGPQSKATKALKKMDSSMYFALTYNKSGTE